jgi:hypothetical protein
MELLVKLNLLRNTPITRRAEINLPTHTDQVDFIMSGAAGFSLKFDEPGIQHIELLFVVANRTEFEVPITPLPFTVSRSNYLYYTISSLPTEGLVTKLLNAVQC